MRQVWHIYRGTRYPAGWITKYVGATARSMGSDPAYVAHVAIATAPSAVFSSWSHARDWVIFENIRSIRARDSS